MTSRKVIDRLEHVFSIKPLPNGTFSFVEENAGAYGENISADELRELGQILIEMAANASR